MQESGIIREQKESKILPWRSDVRCPSHMYKSDKV